jgi:hypothetical protein
LTVQATEPSFSSTAFPPQFPGQLRQVVGEQFFVSSSVNLGTAEFAVGNQPGFWPTPVTLSILQDQGGTVGSLVFSRSYAVADFLSDTNTGNPAPRGTDLVTLDLAGASLSAGDYLIFLAGDHLTVAGYVNLGADNAIFFNTLNLIPTPGDIYHPIRNDGFDVWDLGIILTDAETAVPEPGTLALLVVGLIGLGATRRRRGMTPCSLR